jgi:hypothetical protein
MKRILKKMSGFIFKVPFLWIIAPFSVLLLKELKGSRWVSVNLIKVFLSRKKKPVLLALNAVKFRGDLEILAATDKYTVLKVPMLMQNGIIGNFLNDNNVHTFFKNFKEDMPYEKIETADSLSQTLRVLRSFVYCIVKLVQPSAILLMNTRYLSDMLWSKVFDDFGMMNIVLYREGMLTTRPIISSFMTRSENALYLKSQIFIVHNELVKECYLNANSSLKIHVLGSLRMQNILNLQKKIESSNIQRNEICFSAFSYHEDRRDPPELGKILDATLIVLKKIAQCNPETTITIKLKPDFTLKDTSQRKAIGYIKNILGDVPNNIKIVFHGDVHEILLRSKVVIGLNSTMLLEAAKLGCHVVVPIFTTVKEQLLASERLIFAKDLDAFNIPASQDDYYSMVMDLMQDKLEDSEKSMHNIARLFDKYCTNGSTDILGSYCNCIDYYISNKFDSIGDCYGN